VPKDGKTKKSLILLRFDRSYDPWLKSDWLRIGQDCTLFYRSYTRGPGPGSVLCLVRKSPGGQVIKGDREFRGEGDQIIRICKDKDLKRLA